MHSAMGFLFRHGYVVIFIVVFIEQTGLPIPSSPVLLAAGALAGFHRLKLAPALTLRVDASLISDSLWFALGRRRGGSILKFVCRVSGWRRRTAPEPPPWFSPAPSARCLGA